MEPWRTNPRFSLIPCGKNNWYIEIIRNEGGFPSYIEGKHIHERERREGEREEEGEREKERDRWRESKRERERERESMLSFFRPKYYPARLSYN